MTHRLRWLLLGLTSGASLPVLDSCHPDVTQTVITGFNDLAVALIDAFFGQISTSVADGTTAQILTQVFNGAYC